MIDSRYAANPFPGLRPFETDEHKIFFGREEETDELLARLGRTRFLAVVGPSGSGKSSLIRAGLVPTLHAGFVPASGDRWRVAVMRPGSDPLRNLAAALVWANGGDDTTDDAEAFLRGSSLSLIDYVRQYRTQDDENLLILVDQFEEIFRFTRPSAEDDYGDYAAAFVWRLLEAVQNNDVPIHVVLTMRSDFIGDCNLFPGLPEAINRGLYLIPRLSRDQRREAIIGPIRVSRAFITPQLVDRLLNDVGDNPDQLPILQHALMRTWDYWKAHGGGDSISVEHYEAIGMAAAALSRHADEAFDELPNERSRHIAERIFKGLTDKGEDNREIRRPLVLREAFALTEAGEAEIFEVVETFRRDGRSLLMPPSGVLLTPDTLIDISHESLIRNWARLKRWAEEEAQSARMYRRLAESAVLHSRGEEALLVDPTLQFALDWLEREQPNEAWAKRYHPEFALTMSYIAESKDRRAAEAAEAKRRLQEEIVRAQSDARRLRVSATIMAVTLLFALGAAAFAFNEQRKSAAALRAAEDERAKANVALKEVEAARQKLEEVQRELKTLLNEREAELNKRGQK